MKKNTIFSILILGLLFPVWSGASGHHWGYNKVRVLLDGYVIPIPDRFLVPGVCESADDTYPNPQAGEPDEPDELPCGQPGARYVASTIALVEGKGVKVIVDPGFVGNRQDLLDALAAVNVAPADITHVFISHHHPDHTLNAGLFPNATVVDFWATYKGDLWEDHADKYKIAPGIKVKRTPGHTDEDASLVVKTKHGKVVFTHVYWFNTPEGEFPPEDPLAEDPDALEESRDYVYAVADCIVPGHGEPYPNPQKEDAECVFGDDEDDEDDDDDDDD